MSIAKTNYMIQWITLDKPASYLDTLQLVEAKVMQVINQVSPETIYLLEHQNVYTAGTNSKPEELIIPGQVPVFYVGRGGKFTFHGIGQRVIYPVLNLASRRPPRDLKLYISMLERWIISTLAQLGLKAWSVPGNIGVWVTDAQGQPAKIAAIGVRVKKWVTYHGVAVNISTDLDKFNGIIACGLANSPTTSLAALGLSVTFEQFDAVLKSKFEQIF